ncbi:MAG: hypothetical protein ACPGYT_01755 [Nitrospirales bacterium]
MSKRTNKWLHKIFCIFVVASLTGCDKISIPRLSFDDSPETKAPVSVIYRFDPILSQHTQIVDACGFPYTIKSGEIITQTFLQVGQDHFSSVSTEPLTPSDSPTIASHALTVDLKFIDFSFEPVGRSGEEDRYHTNVGLQLQAIYQDSQGRALAQTPLTYSDKTNLWAPALTSQANSCATGQFDEVVQNAAETLAMDMVGVIPRLYGQTQDPQQPEEPSGSDYASQFPSQSIPVQKPSLSFRTMLQDENDNLVLEGGENLILQVETTNTSETTLPSAYVELRGTPAIIDAFTHVTPLPISIGALQPGEKKTTEVRGRMSESVQKENGKLKVSISISQGIPPGAHTILAAIHPRASSALQPVTPTDSNNDQQNVKKSGETNSLYHAMIVGLDQYRDPWPEAHTVPEQHLQGLANALRTTGTFPSTHIKVLNGTHATRTDIEEALVSLAKHQLTTDSIFLLYYAGHAFIDSENGEAYLTPYEGSPTASKKRLISLRSLQRVLHKLKSKLSILFLDTSAVHYLGGTRNSGGLNGSTPANWHAMIPLHSQASNTRIIQIRRLKGTSHRDPARLLAGLLGGADANKNEIVTLGELLKDLQGTAEVIPSNTQYLPFANIPLAH